MSKPEDGEKKEEKKDGGGGGGGGSKPKLSPWAIPILIILFAFAISIGASTLHSERQSIEWVIGTFIKVAVPALLIWWAASAIGKSARG